MLFFLAHRYGHRKSEELAGLIRDDLEGLGHTTNGRAVGAIFTALDLDAIRMSDVFVDIYSAEQPRGRYLDKERKAAWNAEGKPIYPIALDSDEPPPRYEMEKRSVWMVPRNVVLGRHWKDERTERIGALLSLGLAKRLPKVPAPGRNALNVTVQLETDRTEYYIEDQSQSHGPQVMVARIADSDARQEQIQKACDLTADIDTAMVKSTTADSLRDKRLSLHQALYDLLIAPELRSTLVFLSRHSIRLPDTLPYRFRIFTPDAALAWLPWWSLCSPAGPRELRDCTFEIVPVFDPNFRSTRPCLRLPFDQFTLQATSAPESHQSKIRKHERNAQGGPGASVGWYYFGEYQSLRPPGSLDFSCLNLSDSPRYHPANLIPVEPQHQGPKAVVLPRVAGCTERANRMAETCLDLIGSLDNPCDPLEACRKLISPDRVSHLNGWMARHFLTVVANYDVCDIRPRDLGVSDDQQRNLENHLESAGRLILITYDFSDSRSPAAMTALICERIRAECVGRVALQSWNHRDIARALSTTLGAKSSTPSALSATLERNVGSKLATTSWVEWAAPPQELRHWPWSPNPRKWLAHCATLLGELRSSKRTVFHLLASQKDRPNIDHAVAALNRSGHPSVPIFIIDKTQTRSAS